LCLGIRLCTSQVKGGFNEVQPYLSNLKACFASLIVSKAKEEGRGREGKGREWGDQLQLLPSPSLEG